MGFYYLNALSLLFLGVVYTLAIVAFWLLWTKGLGWRFRGGVVWTAIAAILVAPWIEEFWIAYRFGNACMDSGTFIHKRAIVEGFYDDTHGWRADKLRSYGYRFVEGRDSSSDPASFWRHERRGSDIVSIKIDHPTARYHYKFSKSNTSVSHKIVKHEAVVLDTANGDVLARYTRFSRDSPWFYISLGQGDFSCDSPNRWPLANGTFLIFDKVLVPSQ